MHGFNKPRIIERKNSLPFNSFICLIFPLTRLIMNKKTSAHIDEKKITSVTLKYLRVSLKATATVDHRNIERRVYMYTIGYYTHNAHKINKKY